jgi:tRNA dimethylallyltransferase
LMYGLAGIPDPGAPARTEARTLLAELGAAGLHARLAAEDPVTAARIKPTDGQRVARAWEVWRATGTGLAAWQEMRPGPGIPPPWRFSAILLQPPREELRAAIATRFQAMLREGAVEEVKALLAQNLDPALPAMRAHGVPELSAYLRGETSLETAGRRTELVTGQYTKRQATWFRHHSLAPRLHTIHARYAGLAQFSESNLGNVISFVRGLG